MTERCAVAFQEIGVQMLLLEAPDTDGNPKFETNFLALITPPDALETPDQRIPVMTASCTLELSVSLRLCCMRLHLQPIYTLE